MSRTGLAVTLHRTPLLQEILRNVFGGSRASRVRPRGRESTVRLHTRERSWSWNRIERPGFAQTRTSAQTVLSAADVAPKGARKATLMLLREMQRCTDSVKSE